MKIIHISDEHWDADKLEKCQASHEFILSKVRESKPDLVISTGDFWNKRQTMSNASAFLYGITAVREIADLAPLVIISGNAEHDSPGSIGWFNTLETKYPIYATERAETIMFAEVDNHPSFLKMDEIEKNPRTRPLALVHLFPYPTKAHFLAEAGNLSIDESNKLIQEALRQMFLGMGLLSDEVQCPVILAGHCNVSGAMLSTGQILLGQDIMINKHDLELARADYYALGHIHKAQAITERMHYAGSTYHCNFGETEKKSFNLVEILDTEAPRGLVFSRIEIPSRPLSLHECEIKVGIEPIKDMNPSEQWKDWIDAELRIRVYETKEQHGQINDDELKEYYSGAYSYTIERITIPDERIRSNEIAATAMNLVDKVKIWSKVIGKELPEEVLVLAAEIEGSVEL
jgi:DNA repair exonuclease SbcCD nuclease subunit